MSVFVGPCAVGPTWEIRVCSSRRRGSLRSKLVGRLHSQIGMGVCSGARDVGSAVASAAVGEAELDVMGAERAGMCVVGCLLCGKDLR